MLNVLSLFSGIGAFEKALDNLGISYNLLAYCEIDKHASKAYSLIHDVPEDKNLKDVTKVDFLDIEDRVDLITYGFPCQDISCSGRQQGFTDKNGEYTRSGLFFEALRIIEDYNPKFAIAENVKALTSKKFTEEFRIVLESLEEAGYNNYWQVLNAKDYGIPQNRERVFIISIRKDIDKGFTFPEGFPLVMTIDNLLESKVDDLYYLSDESVKKLRCDTMTGRYKVRNLTPNECFKLMGFSVEDCKKASDGGVSNSQLCKQAGNSIVVNVLEAIFKNLSEKYEEFKICKKFFIAASRGRNPNNPNDRTKGAPTVQRLEVNKLGISNTLTTVLKDNYVIEVDV